MTDDSMALADQIGASHGKNAAGWVFDGNTTDETYARYLKGIEDGDPMVLDSLREPSLSGEYADDYTSSDLLSDLGVEDEDTEYQDELCTAYEDAARAAFWDEVERVARQHVTAGSE